MKPTLLKPFYPARLVALAIVAFWGVLIRPAQAGYTVTLQEVGPDVVATGSGRLDLTGLIFVTSLTGGSVIEPLLFYKIVTGPTSGRVDVYQKILPRSLTGPWFFGSSIVATRASSGTGDLVGILRFGSQDDGLLGPFVPSLMVPRGYVSGTALSDSATYNNATLATLGVTPGTYEWTWGTGANQTFTLKILSTVLPANGPPIVTTDPGALIANFSATLKGSLDADGLSTTFHFQYGTTTSYGFTTAPQTQTGDTSRPVSANIHSLTPHTTYHFRLVASNTAGTRFGSDRTFTTLTMTGLPLVKTNPAMNVPVFGPSARLRGRVNPHGLSPTVYFEYGTTTSYGFRTPDQIKTGNNYQDVLVAISHLADETTYHFRIVATNAAGTRYGNDRTFTAFSRL